MAGYTIRDAKLDDCEQIWQLIKELSVCEETEDQVRVTPEVLRRDGFGDKKFFECLVAEDDSDGKLVGYGMYFYGYSAWEGRLLYLEDFYVTPAWRNKGVGSAIWRELVKLAEAVQCTRMQFVALKWNKTAEEFYKSRNCVNLTEKEDWQLYRLNLDATAT